MLDCGMHMGYNDEVSRIDEFLVMHIFSNIIKCHYTGICPKLLAKPRSHLIRLKIKCDLF